MNVSFANNKNGNKQKKLAVFAQMFIFNRLQKLNTTFDISNLNLLKHKSKSKILFEINC